MTPKTEEMKPLLKKPKRLRDGNYQYINGNYLVTHNRLRNVLIKEAFRVDEELKSDFPDSIDLKITNKCSWGCPYCHESSTPGGKTFSYKRTIRMLSELPRVPIEIAIGGGNILDCPEETLRLVKWLNHRGFKVRATINYKDYTRSSYTEAQKKLIEAIPVFGISVDHIVSAQTGAKIFANKMIVFHIIAGVFPTNELEEFIEEEIGPRVPLLILGYKQWGRAKNTEVPDVSGVEKILRRRYLGCLNGRVISFDNLALEQLHVKDYISPSVYRKIYMGDEGSHSMYIDAVNEEFARTSRSPKRMSWRKIGVIDYFKGLQNGIDN